MKLSICMMVKNEEKYLDKCLTYLQKFMKDIDSELILVDTGSEDRTVDIAKKYTDKVYFHKWNNNFSDMRNITISYAKGEWIFIIDADEMLVEYDDILKLFNSNYIEKYNTVFINVKNLTGVDNSSTYSVVSSARMFKNDGYFKYEGAVHNSPVFKEPYAHINALIEHYGYIFDDKDFTEKKFQRTATILKNELQKNPDNIYYWYQLSVSYSIHNDEEEAIDCILRAFKLIKEKIDKEQIQEYLYVYTQIVLCYTKIKNFKMVEYFCNKAIEDNINHIDIYYLLGKSQLIMEKNYEAIDSYEKYLIELDKYDFKQSISVQTYSHGKKDFVFFDLFILHKRIRQYDKAIEYCSKIKDKLIITNEEFIEENVNLYLDIEDYNGLDRFYNDIVTNYNLHDNFVLYIEKYMDNKKINISRIKDIFTITNSYIALLDFRLYIENSDIDNAVDKIYDISQFNFNDLYYFYGDILYYYIKRSSDKFLHIIKNVREEKIIDFFRYLDNKYDDFKNLLLQGLNINYSEDVDSVILKKIISKYLLIVLEPKHISYIQVFNIYVECGSSYLESVYNMELLEKEKIYWLKDEEEAFLLYMRKAILIKNQDAKAYLYYLRKALNVYPYMNNGVKLLLNEFKENEEENQMEVYKKQVIGTIQALIEINKFKEAKEIINEYEKIIFGDPEIEAMKSMLH